MSPAPPNPACFRRDTAFGPRRSVTLPGSAGDGEEEEGVADGIGADVGAGVDEEAPAPADSSPPPSRCPSSSPSCPSPPSPSPSAPAPAPSLAAAAAMCAGSVSPALAIRQEDGLLRRAAGRRRLRLRGQGGRPGTWRRRRRRGVGGRRTTFRSVPMDARIRAPHKDQFRGENTLRILPPPARGGARGRSAGEPRRRSGRRGV